MKIFVAGATGVVGFPTVHALVLAGHEVRGTARGAEKAQLLRAIGAEPVSVDIYDTEQLRKAMRGCDAAMRLTTKLAGSLTAMRAKSFFAETNRLRTVGARRIVDAALAENVGTYIHESVCFVYRDAGDAIVTESSPTQASAEEMQAVLTGEEEAARLTSQGGRGIVLRFGGFYSADAPSTRDTADLVRRRMLPQLGRASFYLPSIYVEDAAHAIVRSLSAPPGIYNVCDDEPLTFASYLAEVARAVGAKAPLRLPEFLGPVLMGYPWQWIKRSIRASNARLKEVTGWSPRVKSAREGWPLVVQLLSSRRAA
jgi:2-alkyl-3-oxoalkanoate reductase